MGERASELIAVGPQVEEVADRRHSLVAYEGVEVAQFKVEVLGAHLGIELRYRDAVIFAAVPVTRARIRFPTERHGERKILAVEEVGTGSDAGGSV